MLALFAIADFIFVALAMVNSIMNIDSIAAGVSQLALPYDKSAVSSTEDTVEMKVVIKGVKDTSWSSSSVDWNSNSRYCPGAVNGFYPVVHAQCPHRGDTIFMGLVGSWAAYFLVLFAVRAFYFRRFSSADFRAHFYRDDFNSRTVSTIMKVIGWLLTVASTLAGVVILFRDSIDPVSIDQIIPLITFCVLNCIALNFDSHYSACAEKTANIFSCLTDDHGRNNKFATTPIPIKELPGGNGFMNVLNHALFNPQGFYTAMQTALVRNQLSKLTDQHEVLAELMIELQKTDEEFAEEEKMGMEIKNTSNSTTSATTHHHHQSPRQDQVEPLLQQQQQHQHHSPTITSTATSDSIVADNHQQQQQQGKEVEDFL